MNIGCIVKTDLIHLCKPKYLFCPKKKTLNG